MLRLTAPNLARHDPTREWVEQHLPSLLVTTRKERAEMERRWISAWHAWDAKLDQPSYLGRTQVYLAALRQAMETWVVALSGGLFPMTEWFGVEGVGPYATPETTAKWQALQRRYLTEELKLEDDAELFLRQLVTFGTAIYRHVWEERRELRRFHERQLRRAPLDTEADERRLREETDAIGFQAADGSIVRLVEKLLPVKCGPSGRTVDLFHFFVNPISARDLQSALSCWEDLELPFEHLKARHEEWMDPDHEEYGRVYDHPDWESILAHNGILSPEMLSSRQERWERLALDADPNRAYSQLAGKGHFQLTEQFWRGEIPGAADETGRLYGVRDWHIVWVNDTWAVRINPNPFFDQMRPWVDARLFRTVNHYYGQGIPHAALSVQYYLNDTANLTLDNLVLALSPPVVIDEEKVQVPESLKWGPGQKWFVGQDGVLPLQIPVQTQLGMATLNMMQGFIHDFTGANAATQGVPPARGRGRVAQTASGYAQLQATGSQAFQFVVKSLERQWCIPILKRNYHLTEQFASEKFLIQRLGADAVTLITEEVGFEDVFGDYHYTWKGSVGVRERQALVMGLQQLPQLFQIAPPEIAQSFDWALFIDKLLVDGYQVTWGRELFKRPTPEESVDPRLEHEVLAARRSMRVSPADDDAQHLREHGIALLDDDRFRRDAIARRLLVEHRMAHEMQVQAKAQMAQQQQMAQAMAMLMPPPEEADQPQTGSLPNPASALNGGAEPLADAMRSFVQ